MKFTSIQHNLVHDRLFIYLLLLTDTIEENLPKLLSILCEGDVNKNLEKNQGLAKLFAELLDFVFEFDHLKVRNTWYMRSLTF